MNIITFLTQNGFKSGLARRLVSQDAVMLNNVIVSNTDKELNTGDNVVVFHDVPDKTKVFIVRQ